MMRLTSGNKTALVVGLLKQAIHLRTVSEEIRIDMYEAAKKSRVNLGLDFSVSELRSLIDGLHI